MANSFSVCLQNITMEAGRIGQQYLFGVDEICQNSFGSIRGGKRDLRSSLSYTTRRKFALYLYYNFLSITCEVLRQDLV